MMQALHVRREATTILFLDLHLVGSDIRRRSLRSWDADSTEVCSKTFPCCIDFGSGILSEGVQLEEGAIETDLLEFHIRVFYNGGLPLSVSVCIRWRRNIQYSEMCRMLKVSASSPVRPAHAPNSADTIAVQTIMTVVAIHDWRRAGNLVGCPSSDEVSLFASKPSLSSDFTGLYDSVRFCVLMPNILMVQMKRKCEKEKSWEKDDDKTHGYAEIIATTFATQL
jgi:hypothetical protein